jgi:hypothetical protein
MSKHPSHAYEFPAYKNHVVLVKGVADLAACRVTQT